MKVYFIRHCSVDYANNPKTDRDVHLSKIGHTQSIELAHDSLWTSIDTIVTSPLNRAIETVAPIFEKHNIILEFNDGLKELDYNGDAAEFHEKILVHNTFKHPNGESLPEANKRFNNTIYTLLKDKRKPFAVSTHGTVLSQYLIEHFKLDKNFYFKISFPDIFLVEYVNNKPHKLTRLIDCLPHNTLNV